MKQYSQKKRVGLIIEITERTPFSEHYETVATLSYLRDAGMLIALDDFCTGHSSFKYIQQFAVDFLKIDKSFTHKYIKDDISRAIVNCIIGLAHKLNIKLIAEGIRDRKTSHGNDKARRSLPARIPLFFSCIRRTFYVRKIYLQTYLTCSLSLLRVRKK
ncbi:EAL domain-containing protein (plasmid) [Escherichia fergusonii]|nr:EAL domain-containing protein [Escherichia fergusonii]